MTNYSNAGKGLKFMFIAGIGSIICAVAAFIPIINYLAMIAALALVVINIVGLYIAGKDLAGLRTAFIITILQLIVSLFETIFQNSLGTLFSLADEVLSLLVVYFVCSAVGEALEYSGYSNVARTGRMVWWINLACFLVTIAIKVLAMIPILNILAVIASYLILIVSLVGGILYLVFLYESFQALE